MNATNLSGPVPEVSTRFQKWRISRRAVQMGRGVPQRLLSHRPHLKPLWTWTRSKQESWNHLSHIALLLFRYPINVFVPLNTRRDYLFVGDCAHEIVTLVDAGFAERSRAERDRMLLILFARHSAGNT